MNESQKWLTLAALVGVGWMVYLLRPVLTPFLVAALLAYLGDPLVDRLEARKLSRTLSVVIVFTAIVMILLLVSLLLVPMLERQIFALITQLPSYLDWLQQTAVPAVEQALGLEGLLDFAWVRQMMMAHWQEAGSVAAWLLTSLSSSGLALVGWLANLVLVPVVTFYLLRDWDEIVARISELVPRREEPVVSRLARDSDEVLAAFLRGQLTVMMALGGLYSMGLWLVGLELALLIGMLAGLVSFVPYLGFIVGLLSASLAAVFQFHDLLHPLLVLAVFGVVQLIEGMVLTPLFVGDRIGLHPVAVIFAVLAGGQLFGFLGILLALPAAAVVMVLLRYAHERYVQSHVYGAEQEAAKNKSTELL
jgi:Predicted permease